MDFELPEAMLEAELVFKLMSEHQARSVPLLKLVLIMAKLMLKLEAMPVVKLVAMPEVKPMVELRFKLVRRAKVAAVGRLLMVEPKVEPMARPMVGY